jgi:cell fate regulator YaaT (PSP1 superfamily)
MPGVEYLIGFGLRGDFGRFTTAAPLECRRGDRVVIQGSRGVEIGAVLRPATRQLAGLLPDAPAGTLLRRAGAGDERQAATMARRATDLFDRGRTIAGDLGLPLELLDAEVLLDGAHAVLYHLHWGESDVRPLVSTLARDFDLQVSLLDLTRPTDAAEHGCGDCGSGGCGSCGSGGCGSGTCGRTMPPEELQAYFAGLREQMDRRWSLL